MLRPSTRSSASVSSSGMPSARAIFSRSRRLELEVGVDRIVGIGDREAHRPAERVQHLGLDPGALGDLGAV